MAKKLNCASNPWFLDNNAYDIPMYMVHFVIIACNNIEKHNTVSFSTSLDVTTAQWQVVCNIKVTCNNSNNNKPLKEPW